MEVVHGVHVGGHVLLVQSLGRDASQVEVLAHEFIKGLLFKYQVVHFRGQRVEFSLVSLNALLDVHEKRRGQIPGEQSLHSLVHELEHGLQAPVDLLREIE